MEEIETRKLALYQTVLEESATNKAACPEGIHEFIAILIDNKLALAFPSNIDVTRISQEFQQKVSAQIPELKRFMNDPEYGVWISFRLLIDFATGTHLYLFNYDENVDSFRIQYDNQAYLAELN